MRYYLDADLDPGIAVAARALGISERLMGLRVDKYRIEPKRFRTNL